MKNNFKNDFPILLRPDVSGLPLAYLDNAATTQKPKSVIEAVSSYYETYNANPHRGAYSISVRVTEEFENVRAKVAKFIGAAFPEEIVFTFGATDSINLICEGFAESIVTSGDEILLSVTEHHSNLLPWQRLAKRKGAKLVYLEPDESGKISAEETKKKLSDKTRILAITHVSNVLGCINPIKEITSLAHEKGAFVVMDGAQSVPHMPVNVSELGVDFMAFSGHKMLGPAGIGVLYGKRDLLSKMEPARLGGGIVEQVTRDDVSFLDAPLRFEAGTQNAEGVIGLGAAIDYLNNVGMDNIITIERRLMSHALEKLYKIPHLTLYGSGGPDVRTGIISFNVDDVHPHDTATVLSSYGVAVRAGHHCAQPLMEHLGVNATCRMSLYFYNTEDDINRLADALSTVREVLGLEP